MKIILKICLIIVILYIIIFPFGKYIQTWLSFPGSFDVGNTINIGEKISLENNFGNKISGLYLEGDKNKTVLYFLPNGNNINNFIEPISKINNKLGYNVLVFDYPGYGKSEGTPYENVVYDTAQTYYNYLKNKKDISEKNIILLGYSIGSGPAIQMAKENNPGYLVLVSPFTSRYSLAKNMFGFPLQKLFFLKDSFRNLNKIKNIQIPTMIVHGKKDGLIPFWMGEKIYKQSGSKNKIFLYSNNADHDSIYYMYEDDILEYMKNFLDGKIKNEKINL